MNQRERDRSRVSGLILDEIQRAQCWHDIDRAAGALFHMNLIWKSLDDECRLHENENEGCTAVGVENG